MNWDLANGIATLFVYTQQGTFLGSTYLADTGGSLENIRLFSNENGTDAGTSYYQNLMMRWAATPPSGTASFTNGSTTVTGSGFATDNSWNNAFINVAGTPYTIASVQSSTSLTLTATFSGTTENASYTVETPLFWSESAPSYQLTTAVSPSGGGTVSPTSGSDYPSGTVVNLSATASSGYAFSSWTGPVANSGSAATTVTMSAPESVTANFQTTVQVTVGSSPAGLSFTVDGTTYSSAQTLTWTIGTNHTLATTSPQTPDAGTQYTFASWSDTTITPSDTVTAAAGTTSYTASFSTSYQLITAVSPSGGGTVSPTSGSYYPSGTVMNLSATASSGYAFSSWTGPVANSGSAATTVTMSAPESVTANFQSNTVQVTVGSSPAGLSFTVDGTTYSSAQTLTWTIGTNHTLATTSPQTPVAGTQYTFASWSDSGAISHAVTAPATATTYTASFSTSYQLITAVSPSGGGTVSPTSASYYPSGTVVNLSATASSGYALSSWTGPVANTGSAATTVTMSAHESVTANFIAALTIVPSSVSFGTVYLGKKATQSVTLTNIGSTSITISSADIATPGNALGDYSVSKSCTSTQGAKKSCTISLSFDAVAEIFSPTASTATLIITDSAAGSPQQLPLSATVINPLATLSPASVNFSTQEEGTTSAPTTVTLTNTGNTPLTLGTLSISGNFAIVPADTTCADGGTVQPSASCVIGVDFTPTAKVQRTGTLKITDNALTSPQEVTLSGTGD